MTLSYGDMVAITIALGSCIALLIVLTYANIQLLNENRFLKARLQAWRKSYQNQGE